MKKTTYLRWSLIEQRESFRFRDLCQGVTGNHIGLIARGAPEAIAATIGRQHQLRPAIEFLIVTPHLAFTVPDLYGPQVDFRLRRF